MNSRIVLAFVSMTLSITTLPTEFITALEILCVCTSIPIYFVLLIIKGCSFLVGNEPALKTYSKGAPFYNVLNPRQGTLPVSRHYRPICARFHGVLSLRASLRILLRRFESRSKGRREDPFGSVRRKISNTC